METFSISSTSGCSSRHSFAYFKLARVWSFDLSFPKQVENPSLSLFLSSLACIHLGYLRTDISGIDQASSFHLTHISLSFTVISFTPIFTLFDLYRPKCLWKWLLICSTFLGTINLLHFTPLFVFTSSRYHIIFLLFCHLFLVLWSKC